MSFSEVADSVFFGDFSVVVSVVVEFPSPHAMRRLSRIDVYMEPLDWELNGLAPFSVQNGYWIFASLLTCKW